MKTATKIRITEDHIRTGIAGDCHRCAIALAVNEAIEDADCGIVEVDSMIYLIIQSRYLIAPVAVRKFVNAIDELEREADGRPKLPPELPEDLEGGMQRMRVPVRPRRTRRRRRLRGV
jgi:hypothetical protein